MSCNLPACSCAVVMLDGIGMGDVRKHLKAGSYCCIGSDANLQYPKTSNGATVSYAPKNEKETN